MYPVRSGESFVTISPAFNRSKLVLVFFVTTILVVGCAQQPTLPTAASLPSDTPALPTFTVATTGSTATSPIDAAATENATPTDEPDRTWGKLPFGRDKLTVSFYTDNAGDPCVRYLADLPGATGKAKCTPQAHPSIVAVQGSETDSKGAAYTIIVGRVFSDRVTAVSIEFADGTNTPAEISDRGFALVLPGSHQAIRAIPIDQYGNLAGEKFAF